MYNEYQQNDANGQMKEQAQQDNEPLPQYGQVQGQKIFMRGLDYSLLQKQKQQQAKLGLLSNIKNKLFNMQSKIDSRTVKSTPQKPLDQQSIALITTIKNLQNIKPLVNNSTYYLFDTRYHFGKLQPEIITKRLGRMNNQSTYIKVSEQTIAKFTNILQKPKIDKEKIAKDKAFSKLINDKDNDQSSFQEDSDNIFGSESQEAQNPKQKKQPSKKLFNFGQKLDFGVKDQDIFNKKQTKPINQKDLDMFEQTQNISKQKDKYEFLRKKVKKSINPNQNQDDGYGECYFQSGPTFQQMKEYRNAGIEYFGDLKQGPKKGEKKVNIHREYDMVKRIIDEKGKKK